jgi:hypothetical protein
MPWWIVSLTLLVFFKLSLGQESTFSSETAVKIGSYAAIAYSASQGKHGFGVNYPSAPAAAERALNECSKRANDCAIIAAFSKQCAALVVEEKNKIFQAHLAFATSESEAEIEAFANCGNENCTLRRLLCTAGDY